MKNIKIIVTDLDNTLLRTDKTISDYTAGILNKCRHNGIKIVFATARQERNTANFTDRITPDVVISTNGAKVSANGQTILLKHIRPSAVKDIADDLLRNDFIFIIDYESYALTNDKDYLSWAGSGWGVMFTDFTEYGLKCAQRISIKDQGEKAASLIDFDKYGCRIYASQGAVWYAISEKSVSKLTSVETSARHFGCNLSAVISFGDDYNDIEMLKEAGLALPYLMPLTK